MATVLLASAGSGVAGGLGLGSVGASIGGKIGSFFGGGLDDKIFGARRLADIQSARLEELAVQTSTYGKMIPIVFGNIRLGGNIIWSQPIKETANTVNATVSGGKGGGAVTTQNQTNFTYSVSLAIAVCEGEIDEIVRVWADSKVLDVSKAPYRLHKGGEEQEPDSFIESFEGTGKTPAYRGLAYVVIEDFPLADYGNRVPNFTFEVKRKLRAENDADIENRIDSVMMIPASGEFVYDTEIQKKTPGYELGQAFIQNGSASSINLNNNSGEADAVLALNQLEQELPNVEYVSVVVGWFATSLDIATCEIRPGVEYQSSAQTSPEVWNVGNYNRDSAHLIGQENDRPRYGGTPDDNSLIRYIDELKSRGKKVMFYPFIFTDLTGKPWRGRITGANDDVDNFFTKSAGYNEFINHYISLLNGKIDGFCIGSEMIGLTSIQATDNSFPAVDNLVSLAATAKASLGANTTITYAADWSEYHSVNGWYNMDKLWASNGIDVIGIDAYFPLTDEIQTGYDKQKIIDGWKSGEGYDWFYSDAARTVKSNLQPEYAWKNIEWFWKNTYTNPDAQTTNWIPESKKIWFTEYGFPSIDGATNEPNVFYDPDSSESAFPRHSQGRVDFKIQRLAIEATLDVWAGSNMVEKMFLWTWDARPYPYFPDLRNVWSDGNLWLFGHWVNGKFGLTQLAEIIKNLATKLGLKAQDLQLEQINELCDGFIINQQISVRQALEQLQKAYFFDAVESDNKLKFIPRGQAETLEISEEDLIPNNIGSQTKLLETKILQELEMPKKVDISYIDRLQDYQQGNQHAQREATKSSEKLGLSVPIVLNEYQAKKIAEISLYSTWLSRSSYSFSIPKKFIDLEPADVVVIDGKMLRITEALLGSDGGIQIKFVAEVADIYDYYSEPKNIGISNDIEAIADTEAEFLDLPALPNDDYDNAFLRVAATGLGDNWSGAIAYRSDDGGDNFAAIIELQNAATMGKVLNLLEPASANIFDNKSKIRIALTNGILESRNQLAILNGVNSAVIGDEIIQFKNAELVAENTYEISCPLRGRLGTENDIYKALDYFGLYFLNVFHTIRFRLLCLLLNLNSHSLRCR